MIYLYTTEDCPRCDKRKKELIANGIPFTPRDSQRLTKPTDDQDDIDKDAFVQLSLNNMILPVEVEG